MKTIKIKKPLAFSETGQRKNNEDYYLPSHPSINDRLFIVCDGMGGLDKGEEASRITAESVFQYLINEQNSSEITEESFRLAVEVAHNKLNEYMDEDTLVSRMGSTLTVLYLLDNSAIITHIGDSRVYHIRNGEILYKTRDHKQVLDMVDDGIITAEQALEHPWRNRLSRSVSVQFSMEDSPKASYDQPSIKVIEDVKPGDYFFLCTDGVLERIDDTLLATILVQEDMGNKERMALLKSKCNGKTKDNYTAILVQLDDVQNEVHYPARENKNETGKRRSNLFFWITLLIIAALAAATYHFLPELQRLWNSLNKS